MAMSSGSSQPLVLEYKQRRFDGGNEREMIEHIELQNQIFEQQRVATAWQMAGQQVPMYHQQPMHYPQPAPYPHAVQAPPMPQQTVAPAVAPVIKRTPVKDALYKAIILPYIELVLGLSGLLVGNIMFVPLMRNAAVRPEALQRDRQALIEQSWIVVRNSVKSILIAPFAVAKALVKRGK